LSFFFPCSATRLARIILTWSSISARAGGVAHFDQVGKPGVNLKNVTRELRRRGGVALGPGHVFQRQQLHDDDAVMRGLGYR
jgi:hypothetical protein